MQFTLSDKTGDIVTQFPLSSSIFKKYRIDFCCGGNRPFVESLEEKGLDAKAVLTEINELYEQSSIINEENIDWDEIPTEEIIEIIVNRYHAALFQQLPEIGQYVMKIMRVHGANHPELIKLHELYNQFKTDMEQHATDEEHRVFPLILKLKNEPSNGLYNEVKSCIEELDEEHNAAGNILEQMRDITDDYQYPSDACNTYQLTFKKLIEIEHDTFMHVHLENNILFPRVLTISN